MSSRKQPYASLVYLKIVALLYSLVVISSVDFEIFIGIKYEKNYF